MRLGVARPRQGFPVHASLNHGNIGMDHSQQRRGMQRSFSERPAPLRRSSSFFDLLGRVSWASDKDGNYTSSEEDELPPPTPPSPVVSMEEAKASGVCFALSQMYMLVFNHDATSTQ